eukprot:scaffold1431_cov346-Pavlova_lutheri.AAC.6
MVASKTRVPSDGRGGWRRWHFEARCMGWNARWHPRINGQEGDDYERYIGRGFLFRFHATVPSQSQLNVEWTTRPRLSHVEQKFGALQFKTYTCLRGIGNDEAPVTVASNENRRPNRNIWSVLLAERWVVPCISERGKHTQGEEAELHVKVWTRFSFTTRLFGSTPDLLVPTAVGRRMHGSHRAVP